MLKSKGTPLKLHSLGFKPHKKLDGSTGLFEFFFIAMLRLRTRNIRDKVLDSEGTLFQRVDITQDGIGMASITFIDETYPGWVICLRDDIEDCEL